MKIGKGSYSKVYEKDGKAVKKYKNLHKQGIALDMIREVSSLKLVKSEYVIRLLEINLDNIVMPLYNYDLSNYLKSGRKVNIKNFMYTVFKGIYDLHSLGIVHRDIKPSNILVKDENTGILIDTGFCKNLDYDNLFGQKTPNIITTWYRPPEIIDGRKEYSFNVDVWSAGCILAELYLEKHLFNYHSELDIVESQCYLMGTPKYYFRRIKMKNYPGTFFEKFGKYGEQVYNILKGMLQINHAQRWNISQCLNSDYFKENRREYFFSNNLELYPNNLELYPDNLDLYKKYLENYKLDINFDSVSEKTLTMRKIVVLWMLECCNIYSLSDVTYFRSVIFLDKFVVLKESFINKDNFQLISMACLWIASKLESIYPISKEDLIYISKDSFTERELENMEKIVLKTLQFDLITPTLFNYISLCSSYKVNYKNMNKLLFICSLFPEIYKYKFIEIAESCNNLAYAENYNKERNYELEEMIQKWNKEAENFESINERFE